MKYSKLFLLFTVLWGLSLTGCATLQTKEDTNKPFVASLQEFIQAEQVSDVRYLPVKNKDYLIFNIELLKITEEYKDKHTLEGKKGFLINLIEQSHQLSIQYYDLVLNRISPKKLLLFSKKYPLLSSSEKELSIKDRVLDTYKQDSFRDLKKEINKINNIANEKETKRYLKELNKSITIPITRKGRIARTMRGLFIYPFVKAWMGFHILTDDRSAKEVHFKKIYIYIPESTQDIKNPIDQMSDNELLRHYAPTVIVEKKEPLKYEPRVDQLGEFYLEGDNLKNIVPKLNTNKPTLYSYTSTTLIDKDKAKQLVYTLWFPEHPNLLGNKDPEAGKIEGWTYRITLNHFNQPLLYESVANCGCYYKIFPTHSLEDWAKKENRDVLKNKHFHIENQVAKKIDATVPELVHMDKNHPSMYLYYEAGSHHLLTIKCRNILSSKEKEVKSYRLAPYQELENLPFKDFRASLFATDGLVKNAHRLECTLLAPTGMYHAGHPRQRETQLIYFDQIEFEHSKLIEKYLRLPKNIIREKL